MSTTFNYTGAQQTYTVPANVTKVQVECWGAQGGVGGGGSGGTTKGVPGKGGYAKGVLAVTPGQVLYIYVGGKGADGQQNGTGNAPTTPGGWNGGGTGGASGYNNGSAGGGGGGSDVRTNGTAYSNRSIAAGGGGGGGWNGGATYAGSGDGGNGGGSTGGSGDYGNVSASAATGGTQSAGGHNYTSGYNGGLGYGAAGSTSSGGGGGGYYGGGGGLDVGGGGGGSGYIGGVTSGTMSSGVQSGSGKVVISLLNTPPNASTWVTPQDSVIPADQDYVLDWDFSDPDPGDSQSWFRLNRWTVDANKARIAGSLVTVEQATPNTFYKILAGTTTNGTGYEFQVAARDSQGAPANDADLVFSESLFVTAENTPPAPSYLDPTAGATISTSSYTWQISAPNVDTSEWTLYGDDGAGNIDTSTILQGPVTKTPADGDVRTHTWTGLANGVPVWESTRIQDNGLWSPAAQQRNPVSYTPPPVPALALTSDSAAGLVTVAITNPAPGAGEPALSYNDLYVRSPASAPNADRYRPYSDQGVRVATTLAGGATWIDRLAASGVAYEYQVVAVGSNGTTSASGWIPLV